ncbi:hypothetical protein IW262DRAFT_1468805 [Armillaria fumosa]|nr:hypothetical protein IW262DRAFT_1468805 [Armillaria fumosa]
MAYAHTPTLDSAAAASPSPPFSPFSPTSAPSTSSLTCFNVTQKVPPEIFVPVPLQISFQDSHHSCSLRNDFAPNNPANNLQDLSPTHPKPKQYCIRMPKEIERSPPPPLLPDMLSLLDRMLLVDRLTAPVKNAQYISKTSFQDAVAVYRKYYSQGAIRHCPLPGSTFDTPLEEWEAESNDWDSEWEEMAARLEKEAGAELPQE